MKKINSPYENLLGMYFVERKQGFCKIGLSYRKELTNPHGNFHGGVIASVIDTAAVQCLRTIFFEGPYLTADLSIRYKNTSNSSEIFAEANSSHLRGKFFRTDIKVIDKESKLIAEAQVKSFLPRWDEKRSTIKSSIGS